MKIIIDIPKEFNIHWEMDRFKDSLRRMKADAEFCELLSGNYEAELCEMLITAFAEAQEIQTPHGDLIDRDELKENGELVNENIGLYSFQGISMESIKNARTIIKAEQ